MKFKEINESEKPREKLKKYGKENLSDSELLAILLRTGNKNESVIDLSNRILKEAENLKNLSTYSLEKLNKIKGIKLSKSSILLASFELGKRIYDTKEEKIKLNNTKSIFEYFRNDFQYETQEKFFVLLFDTKMNLIKKKEVFRGTLDKVDIHPREIFKEAIKESAKYIAVMHNHPSGDTTPSDLDIEVTLKLRDLGEILGIKLIDHIIISYDSYYSFYEYSKNNQKEN